MAERYGGKYSPEGAKREATGKPGGTASPARNVWSTRRATRAGGRVNFLFVAPLPLIVSAFLQEPLGLALDLAALGVLLFAAFMTRQGVLAHEAYDARKVARRPAIPRKVFGSVLTGAGLALAGYAPDAGFLNPAIFAVLGTALHFFAFGPDPMSDKGAEGVDRFQSDRVARAIDEAEKHLAAMSDAMKRAGDRRSERRLEQFQAAVRDLFRTVEEDPRDLTAARKYLSVYLLGARDATVKFADLYARTRDEKARSDYTALLDDLEQNFAARTRTLLNDNRADLDIEIGVLRDRLAREGVRTD